MDINLKNNKTLNTRILILGILIILLPIFISFSSGYGFNYMEEAKYFVILDTIGIIFLLINTIRTENLVLKETSIIKLYSGLFLEVRILLIITVLYSFSELYYTISWKSRLFTPDTFITLIVALILEYLVIIDIYKLYLLNIKNEFEDYIYENSIIYKISKSIKKRFLTKSTITMIFISILFLMIYIAFIYMKGEGFENPWDIISLFCVLLFTITVILYSLYLGVDINIINTAIHNIAKGNYNNNRIKETVFFKDISENIMKIEIGLAEAVEKAITSEKMKSELITNVSHDLKTPLTSIINYVDLLDNKNISEEKRKLYLGILKERSERLKILVEDLFEASKAASGALVMNMEDLDPVALIRQTLGEFEDKIKATHLNFIKRIPEKKLSMYADGRRTFRVFQNLISNIIKYSLQGTRVYIDIEEMNEYISITFKNISRYPLTFTEEEILERFKRGDSSRTTEGSGLGLSIAKSLVELQGGDFKLKFDGDLFKVTILLKNKNFNLNYV